RPLAADPGRRLRALAPERRRRRGQGEGTPADAAEGPGHPRPLTGPSGPGFQQAPAPVTWTVRMSERPDPTEEVRRLYEEAEKRTADAMGGLGQRERVRRQ